MTILNVNIHYTFFQSRTNSEEGIINIYKSCYWLCKNKSFDNIILSMIVLSSLKLVIDTYIDDKVDYNTLSKNDRNFRELLDFLDMAFNGIFIFELLVKVIALGLVIDYESYLRDNWC